MSDEMLIFGLVTVYVAAHIIAYRIGFWIGQRSARRSKGHIK